MGIYVGFGLGLLLVLLLLPVQGRTRELRLDYDLFDEDNLIEDKWAEQAGLPAFQNFDHKSWRDESSGRDLEVVLNPGPIIAPDVLLGQFEDFNTVNLQENMLEELGQAEEGSGRLNGSETGESRTISALDAIREVSEREAWRQSLSGVGSSGAAAAQVPAHEPPTEFPPNETEEMFDVEELSLGPNGPPHSCFLKINASRGSFTFNFTQDCTYLISAPETNARLLLSCDNVELSNCSATDHKLLVNNWGDLGFGRNSFIYCGPKSQVRVTSPRGRIALRIWTDLSVNGVTGCRFLTRTPRFLNDEESMCGKLGRSSKIVGGRKIAPGLFPYLVQLDITKTSGSHTTCSGSILSDKFILTAAHCLRGVESISVYMGGTDRNEFTGDELVVQAEKFILHRNWNSRTLQADIALVKLSQSVKFTEEISPVCLPDSTLQNEDLTRKKGVAAGWGRISTGEKAPRQAYRVPLPFLSDLRCFLAYRRFFRPKVMTCTESTEEKAICYGDSGGPLMYMRNKRVYQVGISSYSSSKVCGESFDVFTRLESTYVNWITTRLQSEKLVQHPTHVRVEVIWKVEFLEKSGQTSPKLSMSKLLEEIWT